MHNFFQKYDRHLRSLHIYALRVGANVSHQFIRHKCLQQASSLAFNTLLSLVPLSAVALFLLNTFGVVEHEESPLIAALNNFLPRYGAEEIVSHLSGFANRNLGGLSVVGFLLFLLVSTMLFMSVEQHFNDIWGARRRLPLMQAFQKYTVFYTLLSVGPLLIWLFFSTATNWLFAHLFPWILVYCLFFLMYIAMPNTTVKWGAALLGTFVAGTLFQIARLAFGSYFGLVWENYSDIYGALAMLVILAIWTYATWVVILLGAEVTNSVQHFLENGAMQRRLRDENNGYLNAAGVIALFLIVAEHFHKGKGACLAEQLRASAGVSEEVVHKCFELFKAAGLIYEVEGDTMGYLPARALGEIRLHDVVVAVEGELSTHFVGVMSGSPEAARVLESIARCQGEVLKGVTVGELL